MNKKIIFPFALLLFFVGFAPLNGQQNILGKNNIIVAQDQVQDNVITFGGDILIKGKIKKNAIAFGGTIIVEGEVGDVVLGIGADITLKSTATITGDVVSLGGTLTKEPGTIIKGDTIYFNTSDDLFAILKAGMIGKSGISLIPFLIIVKLIMSFIWFILAVILTAIFPRQVIFGSSQVRSSFWPVLGTGIISIIVFTGLIIFSAFLSLIIIGIPILLSLVIIGIVVKIFGQVILFHFFGESLSRAFNKKHPSPFLAVIIGFILVTIIGLIPILGPLFSFVLSLIGWGVVIRTKFGNRENWFARKAV